MRCKVGLVCKPFGTFDTVPLAEAWQVFGCFRFRVPFQVPWVSQIRVYLINVPLVSPRLLASFGYGRHVLRSEDGVDLDNRL